MIELSVVIITRNQDWNTARLVESVLRETDRLAAKEIVLVDSASTDRTTEIAARYPISVLKLCPEQRLTAAAGRYVGCKQTKGDLVLFLDGDMELRPGWLDRALQVMRSQSDVAVISGIVIDRPIPTQPPPLPSESPSEPWTANADGIIDVPHGGGAAMYRRSILERVGSFNPYLYGDEEPELCLRIRHAGYRILRLTRPIVYHYSVPAEALSSLQGRRSRKLYLGFGQNMRYFFGSPLLWPYLRERGWALGPALLLSLGAVAVTVSLLTRQWLWLGLWIAFVIVLTMGIAIRKHSLRRALSTLFRRLLIFDGTVRGLLMEPHDPTGYPGRYVVVRQNQS